MTANEWVPWVVPALGLASAFVQGYLNKAWGWLLLALSMAIMVPYGALYTNQHGFVLYAGLGVMAIMNYRKTRRAERELR